MPPTPPPPPRPLPNLKSTSVYENALCALHVKINTSTQYIVLIQKMRFNAWLRNISGQDRISTERIRHRPRRHSFAAAATVGSVSRPESRALMVSWRGSGGHRGPRR
jgi:hypothetical protein